MQCPELSQRDPRNDIENFRRSLSSGQSKPVPVGIFLDMPDIVSTATERDL